MKYEIRAVRPISLVVSAVPAVLFLVGLVGGIVAFWWASYPSLEPMTTTARIAATGLFALVYMLLITSFFCVIAALYNFFTQVLGLGCVQLDIEEPEEGGEPAQEEGAR